MNEEDGELLILSLGSNLGNRGMHIKVAIEMLKDAFQTTILSSSLYESEPWGFETDDWFLNCCVSLKTTIPPKEILEKTQEIERQIGRTSKSLLGVYESRVIDIDLIYYGNRVLETKELTLPHPLLYERSFVLVPLAELHPNFIDPLKNTEVNILKEALNEDKKTLLYKIC